MIRVALVAPALALRLGLRQVKGLAQADAEAIVAARGAGYDSINVEDCTRRGIYVCNTPEAVCEPKAPSFCTARR